MSPIITLTTDFGSDSHYVAQMKASILSLCRDVTIVDITHGIPPQDIRTAAWTLLDATTVFPEQTVHVAVVDPGVGSDRPLIHARIGRWHYVAPDNGLLSFVARRFGLQRAVSLTQSRYWRASPSHTFDGRDRMAPVAAHVALGVPLEELGDECESLVELSWVAPSVGDGWLEGRVERVDSFGNLLTNIHRSDLPEGVADRSGSRAACVSSGSACDLMVVGYYAELAAGRAVALFGSGGWLEIAVVDGDAHRQLAIAIGDPVKISWQ
ncbi:MAG: SAM-dependent chlorinase/fluorinase [Pirellulaceae bacterium]